MKRYGITVGDNIKLNVRLVDCVGYLVNNAIGYLEDDMPRMVKTPWSTEEIPFEQAAEIGTKKVIQEHSTIGILVTTDGSVTGIEREDYIEPEERVVRELKELNKPFVIVLNSVEPDSEYTQTLAQKLQEKYDTQVIPTDCENLTADKIDEIFGKVLYEFPIERVNISFPRWVDGLPETHWLKEELYDEIKDVLNNFTREDEEQDKKYGENLYKLAHDEIHNENNYKNICDRSQVQSRQRREIVEKIEQYEREGRFDEDVEDDPPSRVLLPEEIDYTSNKFLKKFRTRYAFKFARWYLNSMIREKKVIIKGYEGVENFKALNSGAVITCNHFNAYDSFAMELVYDKAQQQSRKLYRIIKEGNYTSFPGFYGFLMRNCNTLPLSSNMDTMKKFISAVNKLLSEGNFILIYPEQSMWWNYRKPKPLKTGAYKFAARNNVPVLPVFMTMQDSDIIDSDGFPVQEYTIHVAPPIYPDASKSEHENAMIMMKENYRVWKDIYEKVYDEKLTYTCGMNFENSEFYKEFFNDNEELSEQVG